MAAVQAGLARAQRWWHYFTRRELQGRLQGIQAELVAADAALGQARTELEQIEEQGGARYPGLSREARRMLNLTAIASAQVLALRLAPPSLLARTLDAMSRGEPRGDGATEAAPLLAAMQEIARAKAAMTQNAGAMRGDVRRLADQLASQVKFRTNADTLPTEDSVQAALRAGLEKSEQMHWDVLAQDLWSLSDLFYVGNG